MPLEPLGLVTGDPFSYSAVSKLDHLMPTSQLLLFCLLQPKKEGASAKEVGPWNEGKGAGKASLGIRLAPLKSSSISWSEIKETDVN